MQTPKLLVTGFGPFGDIAENPSQHLAESCGEEFRILPVSYAAVDQFVEELRANAPERLLLLGAHGRAEPLHIELVAHNRIGDKADVDGVVAGPGRSTPPANRYSALPSGATLHSSANQRTGRRASTQAPISATTATSRPFRSCRTPKSAFSMCP